jgi:hypothetical protein
LRGPDAIVIGSEIVASIVGTASLLHAVAITVYDDETVTLNGRVEAVDVIERTIRIAGVTVHITDSTLWTSTLTATTNPRMLIMPPAALQFSVDAVHEQGRLVAVRIGAPQPPQTTTFYAVVANRDGNPWTIRAGDGRELQLRITERSSVVGAPAIGDTIIVTALFGTDAAIALSVEKTAPPVKARMPFAYLVGEVIAIDSTSMTTKWGEKQTLFKIAADTIFAGVAPKVGDTVYVYAQILPDGTNVAREVTVRTDQATTTLTILGRLSAINGAEWTVGSWKVEITPTTVIQGNPQVGDMIFVEGRETAKDRAVATLVVKR